MIIFTTPLLLYALIAMCAIHVITSVVPGIVAKILNYVNLVLHIATLYLLMYTGAKVNEALLLYMISMFIYSLVYFVRYEIVKLIAGRKENARGEEAEA
jgi:hypothetical protein